MEWYLEQFEQVAVRGLTLFEKTPTYYQNPNVPKRIFDAFPDMKLIISGLFSHFFETYLFMFLMKMRVLNLSIAYQTVVTFFYFLLAFCQATKANFRLKF